jgi:hypothetical protein
LNCTMERSFFSQKMPYFLLTLLVYMALAETKKKFRLYFGA